MPYNNVRVRHMFAELISARCATRSAVGGMCDLTPKPGQWQPVPADAGLCVEQGQPGWSTAKQGERHFQLLMAHF